MKVKKRKIRFVQSLFDFVLGCSGFYSFFNFSPFFHISFTLSVSFALIRDRVVRTATKENSRKKGEKKPEVQQKRIEEKSISTTMSAVNGREKIYLNLNNKFKSHRFIHGKIHLNTLLRH